jgi:hypothetical protein
MDAPAGGPQVMIAYEAYNPAQITALSGDTVMWHNESPRSHTVTADDGSFGSGTLFSSSMYEHQFAAPGSFRYYCTVHPDMHGEVDVYDLLLDQPKRTIAPGEPLTLQGRAALQPGTQLSLEADEGTGFRSVATTTVTDAARFEATIHPAASASYRIVAAGTPSPSVAVRVVDRNVRAAAARHGRRATVSVRVVPAAPGATAVLQVASREHFGWWPTRRARLDRSSRARFTVSTRRRLRMRVVLTLRDGATILARSHTVRVGAARR